MTAPTKSAIRHPQFLTEIDRAARHIAFYDGVKDGVSLIASAHVTDEHFNALVRVIRAAQRGERANTSFAVLCYGPNDDDPHFDTWIVKSDGKHIEFHIAAKTGAIADDVFRMAVAELSDFNLETV